MKTIVSAAAGVLLTLASPAAAQDARPVQPGPDGQPDVPTSSAADAAICTDRPTKSNFACTVPKGQFQIESDIAFHSIQRGGGARVDVTLFTNPTFKYGVGDSTDIEANIAPLVRARTRVGDVVTIQESVGDLTLRVKQRLTPTDRPVQFAVIPYVKVPTAERGIGNREWEGGVIAPANISLPDGFTLTLVPQLDFLLDGDGRGRHAQFQGVVNLGRQIAPDLTLYGELWTAQNFDPADTVRQYSADAALAYLVTPTLQLDVGANFGLNRATPDAQVYVGVSTRF